MSEYELPGLDGTTPLGFLAGLGLVRLLWERGTAVRISWPRADGWHAHLHDVAEWERLVDVILEDAHTSHGFLRFAYAKLQKSGEAKRHQGLTPQVAILRAWLKERIDVHDDIDLAYTASWTSETVTDLLDEKSRPTALQIQSLGLPMELNSALDRMTLATAFDFTSRNTQFLDQIRLIGQSLQSAWISQELQQGHSVPEDVRTMGWDSLADAPGALFGLHGGRKFPTMEWLAFRGLAYYPVFGHRTTLKTTGCRGRRKKGRFIWPVWEGAASHHAIRSIVSYPDLDKLPPARREQLALGGVFSAELKTTADGYGGAFAPSELV